MKATFIIDAKAAWQSPPTVLAGEGSSMAGTHTSVYVYENNEAFYLHNITFLLPGFSLYKYFNMLEAHPNAASYFPNLENRSKPQYPHLLHQSCHPAYEWQLQYLLPG